jgi:hypothetical protein
MSWRWILENPQLLVVIGGAIAYWLNERRKAKETREMAEEARREPDADEMAERTRRIQEEIRRKIEERQGRVPQPPPLFEAEENVEGPASVPPPLPQLRPVLVSAEEAPGAAELERVMEQQRRYAEQVEQLAAAERAAKAYASAQPGMAVYSMPEAGAATRASRHENLVLAGLHDRDALRRAIVLREVLGAPKALQ